MEYFRKVVVLAVAFAVLLCAIVWFHEQYHAADCVALGGTAAVNDWGLSGLTTCRASVSAMKEWIRESDAFHARDVVLRAALVFSFVGSVALVSLKELRGS